MAFVTLDVELGHVGTLLVQHFRSRGYAVRIEPINLQFPRTPTLVCTRRGVTVVVEVTRDLGQSGHDEWVRFGAAARRATKLVIVLPMAFAPDAALQLALGSKGIGIILESEGTLSELIPPKDLSIAITLPQLATLSPKIRELLGTAYDKFERGEWKDGLKETCEVVEKEVQKYLVLHGVTRKRLSFFDSKGRPLTLTRAKLNKEPLGGLVRILRNASPHSGLDSELLRSLTKINEDRKRAIHPRNGTEARLRRVVSELMNTIIEALLIATPR